LGSDSVLSISFSSTNYSYLSLFRPKPALASLDRLWCRESCHLRLLEHKFEINIQRRDRKEWK